MIIDCIIQHQQHLQQQQQQMIIDCIIQQNCLSTSKSLKQKRFKSLNTDLLKLRKSRTYEKERTCKHSYITITNNKTINNTKDRQTDNGENKETDWKLEHLNTAVLSLIKKFRNPFRNFVFLSHYFIFSVSSCEQVVERSFHVGGTSMPKRRERRNNSWWDPKLRKQQKQKKWKQPVQKTSAMRSFVISPHPFPPLHWFVRYFSP